MRVSSKYQEFFEHLRDKKYTKSHNDFDFINVSFCYFSYQSMKYEQQKVI